MNNPACKCPTPEMIFKYFYRELSDEELTKIESHFSECSKCISEYDFYGEFIEQIILSARVQKELWASSNADTFSVAAAGSYDTTEASELISNNGEYLLKKIPFMDDSGTSLLVVKVMYPGKQGRISVYLIDDSTSSFIGSELIDEDNKVCFEVSSDIQLTKILVTFI
jgi:hypothetical protein